jgi:hypothetical protein
MYTIYDRYARKVQRDDWDKAVYAAKQILLRTQTENGHVAPVSIWRNGVVVGIVTDDANGVSVHRICCFAPKPKTGIMKPYTHEEDQKMDQYWVFRRGFNKANQLAAAAGHEGETQTVFSAMADSPEDAVKIAMANGITVYSNQTIFARLAADCQAEEAKIAAEHEGQVLVKYWQLTTPMTKWCKTGEDFDGCITDHQNRLPPAFFNHQGEMIDYETAMGILGLTGLAGLAELATPARVGPFAVMEHSGWNEAAQLTIALHFLQDRPELWEAFEKHCLDAAMLPEALPR